VSFKLKGSLFGRHTLFVTFLVLAIADLFVTGVMIGKFGIGIEANPFVVASKSVFWLLIINILGVLFVGYVLYGKKQLSAGRYFIAVSVLVWSGLFRVLAIIKNAILTVTASPEHVAQVVQATTDAQRVTSYVWTGLLVYIIPIILTCVCYFLWSIEYEPVLVRRKKCLKWWK